MQLYALPNPKAGFDLHQLPAFMLAEEILDSSYFQYSLRVDVNLGYQNISKLTSYHVNAKNQKIKKFKKLFKTYFSFC